MNAPGARMGMGTGAIVGGLVIVVLIIVIIVLGVLYSQKSSPTPPSSSCLVPAVSTQNAINLKTMLDSQMSNCSVGNTKYATWMDQQGILASPVNSQCPTGTNIPPAPSPSTNTPSGSSFSNNGITQIQAAGFQLCVPSSYTPSTQPPTDVKAEMAACALTQLGSGGKNGQCSVM